MKLRTQDYQCLTCGIKSPIVIEIADDAPSVYEGSPATQPCPECGAEAEKRFSAPGIMQRAMPDGTFRGEGWQLSKEIAKLKRKKRDLKGEAKKEAEKEIANLNSTIIKRNYRDKFNS